MTALLVNDLDSIEQLQPTTYERAPLNRDEKLQLVTKWFYPRWRENLWMDELANVVNSDSVVLEIGSGSGRGKQNQSYPDAAAIWGIDLDERVLDNPFLTEARHISAYEIAQAFPEQKFDVVYSLMVAEHIDDADRFINNQLAVLGPGGVMLHATVSGHYWTSLINNLTPEKLKNWLISALGGGRGEADIFPAHYKMNTARQIRRLSQRLQLDFTIIRQDGPPGYLRRSMLLMLIYTAIHKPLQFVIPSLRPTFIVLLRPAKKAVSSSDSTTTHPRQDLVA